MEANFPWLFTQQNGESYIGKVLKLWQPSGDIIKFTVNTSPIYDVKGELQGVLATFDDVTELEEKNQQLVELVTKLEVAQEEIKERNKELHYMATRDPLTGCLNRRAFYQAFELEFNRAKNESLELTCFMVDLDKFKLVNDNYGHATGDEVIRMLADVLHSNTRKIDLVGRYGGEEFCVVLPGLTVEEAISVAERIRLRVNVDSIRIYAEKGPTITASIGVASIFDHAVDAADLNDQADRALYIAKESGRNRVVRWDPDYQEVVVEKTVVPSEDKTCEPESGDSAEEELTHLRIKVKELEGIATKFSYQLERAQNFDGLTGLPSHALFCDRISQSIYRARRYHSIVAVLMINVDVFNRSNTTLDISGGDFLLKRLAERLESILRNTDGLTLISGSSSSNLISRFGEEEFGILLNDLTNENTTTWIIKRIFDSLSMPVVVNEQKLFMACSLGVSLYPFDAEEPEVLIQYALTAKQFAKHMTGENNFHYYNVRMQNLTEQQMENEIEVKRAIENQEWEIYYQPKIELATRKLRGFEVLLRWQHPRKGLLEPEEFFEFIEERGYILPIGDWVLRAACTQAKEWLNFGLKDFKVAVNLSAKQLQNKKLVNQILKIMEEIELPARYIEFEITELILKNNFEIAEPLVNRLHAEGIQVVVEDFGIGGSVSTFLKHMQVAQIKIDRCLINNVDVDEYSKKIVKSFISLAHDMGMTVCAEAVERQGQADCLKAIGCDLVQGHLVGRSLPSSKVLELFK